MKSVELRVTSRLLIADEGTKNILRPSFSSTRLATCSVYVMFFHMSEPRRTTIARMAVFIVLNRQLQGMKGASPMKRRRVHNKNKVLNLNNVRSRRIGINTTRNGHNG